jgi:hypothetical protein
MTKIIKGDLILTEDTCFKESIEVDGNIKGRYNLKVSGNIDAWNINACNIDACNIDACNIDACNINACNIDAWNIKGCNIYARNINAWNINAWNIDARNIIYCEEIKIKSKVFCKQLITQRSSLKVKEWKI